MFNNSYQTRWFVVTRVRVSRVLIACLLLVLSTLAVSCSRGYSRFMKLPPDPMVTSELGWAVVTSAYARAKLEPGTSARDGEIVRRGTIFRCSERRIDPAGQDVGGLWYRMGEQSTVAWLHESDLSIFPSEEQAREAAAALP